MLSSPGCDSLRSAFFICLCFAITTGCAKNSSTPASRSHGGATFKNRPPLEDLDQLISKNFASDFVTECDEKNKEVEIKIAKALKAHEEEIKTYLATPRTDPAVENIFLGPLILIKDKTIAQGKDRWQQEDRSWDDINKDYEATLKNPTTKNWVLLNRNARGMFTDDYDRLVLYKNVELSRKSEPFVRTIENTVTDCVADENCPEPNFEEAQKVFIKNNKIYNWYFLRIENAKTSDAKRYFLRQFKNVLEDDYEFYFGFKFNAGVTRKSLQEFEVLLDAGEFAGYENILEDRIKAIWTSADRYISIKWGSFPLAYKFVNGGHPGERPMTRWSKKNITINQGNFVTSIPHEFGHVIGLMDHYYNQWNPQTCSYRLEYNDGDVMSESASGAVTAEDWQELEKNYSLKNP